MSLGRCPAGIGNISCRSNKHSKGPDAGMVRSARADSKQFTPNINLQLSVGSSYQEGRMSALVLLAGITVRLFHRS